MDPAIGSRGGKSAGAPTFRDALYGSTATHLSKQDEMGRNYQNPYLFPRLDVKPDGVAAKHIPVVDSTASPSSRSLAEWNNPRRCGISPSFAEVVMVGFSPDSEKPKVEATS